MEMLAQELRIDPEYVSLVSRSASHRYKEYKIPKARGGQRTIQHPSAELKSLQYWLTERILRQFSIHKASTAYSKGSSIRKNATFHLKKPYLLRMDFENFFESMSAKDLRTKILPGTVVDKIVLREQDIDFMCNVLFRFERMTIGAPSSPILSNILMYDFDERVYSYCEKNDVVYTRYADDMFFSTSFTNKLKNIEKYVYRTAVNVKCPGDLRVNKSKTRHSSKKGHRYVTGVTLTCDNKISLGRAKKREIRSKIHTYLSGTYIKNQESDKLHLRGLLFYAKDIESQFINRLMIKYGADEIKMIMS